MKQRSWNELGPAAKVAVGVGATVQIGLLVAALVDLARRPADRIRGPKLLWVPITFINFLGPLAYFIIGRKG